MIILRSRQNDDVYFTLPIYSLQDVYRNNIIFFILLFFFSI